MYTGGYVSFKVSIKDKEEVVKEIGDSLWDLWRNTTNCKWFATKPVMSYFACMNYNYRIGQRQTPQRAAILDYLSRMTSPLTAEEIHRGLLHSHPNLNLSTVYRNLEKMEEAGLVNSVRYSFDASARYLLSSKNHIHHLICRKCHRTIPLDFCPLESVQIQSQSAQFTIEGHCFEVYGSCKECSLEGKVEK